MDKAIILFALAFILIAPLCLDSGGREKSPAEQPFLDALKQQNLSRADLLAAIDSRDYTEIRRAISKYNHSTQRSAEALNRLCADKGARTEYSDACAERELTERCNARDVEGISLIMRVIHDPSVSREDCDRLLSVAGEQEECRNLAQSYVPARGDLEEIAAFCDKL